MRFVLLTPLLTALVASAAVACETEPDFFILPGESEGEAHTRTELTHDEQWVIRYYRQETYAFEKATSVYLARVVANTPAQFTTKKFAWPTSTVRPIRAVKGTLPTLDRTLTDKSTGGQCLGQGDGWGATAKVSALVFVFEGLAKSDQMPNGIHSIRAGAVRTDELLVHLKTYLHETAEK